MSMKKKKIGKKVWTANLPGALNKLVVLKNRIVEGVLFRKMKPKLVRT